jgi:S-adenosylmethionine-diacylgycerolhomoserine-N-methlytransferase
MTEHGRTMDRLYRFQRHFYDATRPFFLLGRDALLDRLEVAPGHRVLEMGCGTARNLIALAKRRHDIELFGVDASNEMLRSAQKSIRRSGHGSRITVARCFAEEVDYKATFGLDDKLDRVFYSYSLSMIPEWKAALDAGFRNLKPGGTLHVVDFWDQAKWPRPLRAAMIKW